MHSPRGSRRLTRAVGTLLLLGSVTLALGTVTPSSAEEPTDPPATSTPDDSSTLPDAIVPKQATEPTSDDTDGGAAQVQSAYPPPYGNAQPVKVEATFSRPSGSYMKAKDFSLLDDLERLVKGSYYDYEHGQYFSRSVNSTHKVFLSVSRMENSHRVGRRLVEAAKRGVNVYVIHGKASQSKESRALAKSLTKYKNGHFHICAKGKSLACLSQQSAAIMHSKILIVNKTFDRDNNPATGAVWSGSANLGGPSGEYTYNNGWTVYNDEKIYNQAREFFADMYSERNINNDYLTYIKDHSPRYGVSGLTSKGYTGSFAVNGMFYSNLSNTTYYPTPIRATPTNGKDPVLAMLNRIIPDDQCRIRVQHNRFKYRRIAVAQKLVQLADAGCKVDAVSFEDDLKVNRIAHCQLYIRICQPILDVFRTADVHIDAAWAKPHDKTMLVEAKFKANKLNPEELPPGVDPSVSPATAWSGGVRLKLVQAGSAALTASNLIASDEITTESTNPELYEQYLEHWRAINVTPKFHPYPY
ncbi:phospholipase D-like domain-containing protein [Aeromicrobium terrae]|uniref:PLD phosphodiesterase domain-containing protein n=1 Tax=Aeromicrobium terrae TaxID=2498846 RepID=A0A5C8NP78_9ACTN|nr:phospholipase D-like domain-containing protein [Aeromicrobium terrae]TXL62900.1 hypothetical protein FHP06_01250 [Aeromicrobium terrae]